MKISIVEENGTVIVYEIEDWRLVELRKWLEFKGAKLVSDEIEGDPEVGEFSRGELEKIRDKSGIQANQITDLFLKDGFLKLCLAAETLNALLMKERILREEIDKNSK